MEKKLEEASAGRNKAEQVCGDNRGAVVSAGAIFV
jgi:hypothetical protein